MNAVAPGAGLRLVLEGQLPSGKNQVKTVLVHGLVRRIPNARFEAWRADAFRQLSNQRGAWPTLETPALLRVRYTPGDRLRRDVPGIMDAICHLLEWCPIRGCKSKTCKIPVVRDDALLVDWDWRTLPLDRARPRATVEIEPYPAEKRNGK